MEAYEGVAVAAFVVDGEGGELERGPAGALGDDQPVGREHGADRRSQRPAERLRVPVWRIQEDQIVLTGVLSCGAQKGTGVAPHDLAALDAAQIRPDRPHGGGVAVDERRRLGTAAERL